MSYTALHLALSIRIGDPAGKCDGAIVRQHVAIERIQRRIVDVGLEDAFAEVVEHNRASGPAESPEGLFMQFRPDASVGVKGENTDSLTAIAEGKNEQPGAAVLAGMRVADHRPGAIVDLRFLSWSGDDDRAGLRRRSSAQPADKAFDALVAAAEAVIVHQVLVDSLRVPALVERQFDEVEVGFAGAGGGAPARCRDRVGVGGHFVGRF